MAKKLIAIEALVRWAYGVEHVGRHTLGNVSAAQSTLGLVDTGGGSGGGSSPPHTDALLVDMLISDLHRRNPMQALLLRKHAGLGDRPDWRPNARCRIEAKHWLRDGAARWSDVWWTEAIKGSRYPSAPYCPIVAFDTPAEVERDRRLYLEWFIGLDALRSFLSQDESLLHSYRLNEVMPPRVPWQTSAAHLDVRESA